VDDLILVIAAKDGFDLLRLFSGDAGQVIGAVVDQAAPELVPEEATTLTVSPVSNLPVTCITPTGSRLPPFRSARTAPASTAMVPWTLLPPARM